MRKPILRLFCALMAATSCFIIAGCQSGSSSSSTTTTPSASAESGQAQPAAPTITAPANEVFRIKAGTDKAFTDSAGNVWQPDQGFDGGDVIDRDPATVIANTKDANLFLTEHYGMNSFSCKIANGKYIAKLYFAETFEGVTGPGQRVFSFNVQGQQFDDFDVFVKAGGADRAYVETVPVEVTNGVFRIDFTAKIENPEINAIEIIPQS